MRIPEGDARATGPNEYGSIYAKTVIHAVGPRYPKNEERDGFQAEDNTLRNAYAASMRIAQERSIKYLGFSLLSAGIFSGAQDLAKIVRIGIEVIVANSYEGLQEVHLVGFSPPEQVALRQQLKQLDRGRGGGGVSIGGGKKRRSARQANEQKKRRR